MVKGEGAVHRSYLEGVLLECVFGSQDALPEDERLLRRRSGGGWRPA